MLQLVLVRRERFIQDVSVCVSLSSTLRRLVLLGNLFEKVFRRGTSGEVAKFLENIHDGVNIDRR